MFANQSGMEPAGVVFGVIENTGCPGSAYSSITSVSLSRSINTSLSNLEKANHFLPRSFKEIADHSLFRKDIRHRPA